VTERGGTLAVFDVTGFRLLFKTKVAHTSAGYLVGLLFDPMTGNLLVLCNHQLYVYRFSDMAILQVVDLEDAAYGIIPDWKRGRVLISYPMGLRVAALDRNTFESVGHYDAPVGVRLMGIDEERQILITASVSGVLEGRYLGDGRRAFRVRLAAWPHWLEVFPEYGEVVITTGETPPFVWRYSPANWGWDFGDSLLRILEAGMRYIGDHKSFFHAQWRRFISPS